MRCVTVPGIGGSGPDHWQTHWDADLLATRIRPASWDAPDPVTGRQRFDRAVTASDTGVVLVAHSLGCLAAAAWLLEHGPGHVVAAAMLVAVPNPDGPDFPEAARGFAAVRGRLPLPTLVVVSDDDPYGEPTWVGALAADWGATVADVGPLGHINAASSLGAWPEGRRLLTEAGGPPPGTDTQGPPRSPSAAAGGSFARPDEQP